MLSYLVRRLVTAAVGLLLASLLVFSAVLAIPGDPAEVLLGFDASPAALAAVRTELGLDRPPVQRYLAWLGNVARGDLGTSLVYDRPVRALVAERLAVSVPLTLLAGALATLLALPLGITAARLRGRWPDPVLMGVAQLGAAVPSFWLGLLLVLVFAVDRGWLPAAGFVPWREDPIASLRSLVLPVLALSLGQAALLARMTRAAMVDALATDYVRTARAKGVGEGRVVRRHALRNALLPIVTILGLALGNVFIGSIVIEEVFALPGLGRLALSAIGNRDLPLLQGEVLLYASVLILLSLLVDLAYAAIDPRVRIDA
jgi:peptide/nickel transport system permease protein